MFRRNFDFLAIAIVGMAMAFIAACPAARPTRPSKSSESSKPRAIPNARC